MCARNAGLFSNFNGLITRLKYTIGPHDACEVEWRTDRLAPLGAERQRGRSLRRFVCQTEFPYGSEGENAWLQYFRQLPFNVDPKRRYSRRRISDPCDPHGQLAFGIRRGWGPRASELFRGDQRWRHSYNDIYSKYVVPLDSIMKRVETFIAQCLPDTCIGVHIRNPKQAIEQVRGKAFAADNYISAIRQAYGAAPPIIFVATDMEVLLFQMQDAFGAKVVFQRDAIRTPIGEEGEVHAAKTPNPQLGSDVVTDAMILARCSEMFHVISNVALAVAYMNPKLKLRYIGRFLP